MEVAPFHPLSYSYLFPSSHLIPYHSPPQNYVQWTQTPESHLYSADIPGVRKEEIKVEVEDSRYLIIRTEALAEEAHRSFSRKFRLPEQVDVNGISASGGAFSLIPLTGLRYWIFLQGLLNFYFFYKQLHI